jgi:hypothetical protein
MPALLLAALFALTVCHLVTLKICSVRLDHRAAPLFISGWTLLGLAAVSPFYGHLWGEGAAKLTAHPLLILFCAAKAGLLWFLLVISQRLMKESLSSRHYVTPMALGVIAGVNHFLGENLTAREWAAAGGLCALSAAFFFKGHLSQLSKQGRIDYFLLVALTSGIAALDHTLTRETNWFTLLLAANLFLFALSLLRAGPEALKSALLQKPAMAAGAMYAATELVKFYQQVTINPVSVVVMTQAMTKPVILILSALIWKERTVREQAAWGLAAFVLVSLPFLWPAR